VALVIKLTFVAAVPAIRMVAAFTKFAPLIVISVPPAVDPDVGETPVTVAAEPLVVRVNVCTLHVPVLHWFSPGPL